jgi:IMP dehydrogenase
MYNTTFRENKQLFNSQINISTGDVLLVPRTGCLTHRKDAIFATPFIYTSPIDTVTGISLTEKVLQNNQAAVFCRFLNDQEKYQALSKYHFKENFWFSVGASLDDFEAINLWVGLQKKNKNITINISVDVAHGDTLDLHKVYALYRKRPWCRGLMSGTVATYKSAKNVFDSGCTHIRVGIGPGSACTTRVVTGCGVPNLSAVFDIYSEFQYLDLHNHQKPIIIADGGIKNSGDIVKYLSAGADGVMIGRLFSQSIESSGWQTNSFKKIFNFLTFNFLFKNYIYKKYRGQASQSFQLEHRGYVSGTPEGVTGPLQHPSTTCSSLINNLKAGVASAISYLGLESLKDLNPSNVKFIRISPSSQQESKPHLLNSRNH